ncbi:hypothetical protein [Caudoviricetes sp.]|nr:hypothetical protein [Caudoviricetes sp.]
MGNRRAEPERANRLRQRRAESSAEPSRAPVILAVC